MKTDHNLWQGETRAPFCTASSVAVWMGGGFEDGNLSLEFCVNTQKFLMWLCDLLEAGVPLLLIVGEYAT